METVVFKTHVDNLFLLPATLQLAGVEIELAQAISRELRLQRALQVLDPSFEFVIIDCPPSLGIITLNALTASHSVLIPIQCEFYALEGLGQLLHTVRIVQQHLNKFLAIEGVLLTMFDARTNLSTQVAGEVRNHFVDKVYTTVIPRNIRLSEAPSHGQSVLQYDAKSRGAECYRELAREVVRNNG